MLRNEIQFKRCSCGRTWASRESFIRDTDVKPIGITFAEKQLDVFYFFNHINCMSTLAVKVEEFMDLIEEPIPSIDSSGAGECPKCCSSLEDVEACNHKCPNAPFRRFLVERLMKRDI